MDGLSLWQVISARIKARNQGMVQGGEDVDLCAAAISKEGCDLSLFLTSFFCTWQRNRTGKRIAAET